MSTVARLSPLSGGAVQEMFTAAEGTNMERLIAVVQRVVLEGGFLKGCEMECPGSWIGDTDYIDNGNPKDMGDHAVCWGRDEFGRSYVAFRLQVRELGSARMREIVFTVFQRYSNEEKTVAQGGWEGGFCFPIRPFTKADDMQSVWRLLAGETIVNEAQDGMEVVWLPGKKTA